MYAYAMRPYILPTALSSSSTIRYQWKLLPSTGFVTARLMRKSSKGCGLAEGSFVDFELRDDTGPRDVAEVDALGGSGSNFSA